MKHIQEVITEFESLVDWIEPFKKYDYELLFKPMAEGKWSVAELLSHLMFWDRFIINDLTPIVKPGVNIELVDFNEYNGRAAEYAKSGLSVGELLEEIIATRKQLCSIVRDLPEEKLLTPIKVGGEEIDRHTGNPHSIFNYVCDFIHHDNYHKKQVEDFLEKATLQK
ncbi:hypothetical protein GCM10008967_02500 [Bacillus carboniphilus]|uniref:DinB-like domain-containing protein n=1 Tax=Bacillus carboniphilus TaxID=86663 RepID=A0ABN0VRI9_9BACI